MSLFNGKTFLVVDDEPDLREILRDELEFAGAKTEEAENGVKALGLVESKKFDAVLSDIRMPGGDGMTLASKIKNRTGPNPVVFLVTGFADFTPADAYEAGVEGFVYKPFNLGPVLESLRLSLLPPEQRWSLPPAKPPNKTIQIGGTGKDFLNSSNLKLGRGGFFLEGSFADLRKEELLKLQLAEGDSVTVVVRWVQAEDALKKIKSGIGVEFVSISPEVLVDVMFAISKLRTPCFIPQR
jgi:CheY-like chemotaxis protein